MSNIKPRPQLIIHTKIWVTPYHLDFCRLEKLGALEKKLVVQDGEEWRLVSCIWLHAGAIHLIANMLSLLFIGIRLEREFGFCKNLRCRCRYHCAFTLSIFHWFELLGFAVRIGLLYVISGFGGSLLSAHHLRKSISVGASGALFGLLGAMLSELFINWTIYANKVISVLPILWA